MGRTQNIFDILEGLSSDTRTTVRRNDHNEKRAEKELVRPSLRDRPESLRGGIEMNVQRQTDSALDR